MTHVGLTTGNTGAGITDSTLSWQLTTLPSSLETGAPDFDTRDPEAMARTYLTDRTMGSRRYAPYSRLAECILRSADVDGMPPDRSHSLIAAAIISIHLDRGNGATAAEIAAALISRHSEDSEVHANLPWLQAAAGRAFMSVGRLDLAIPLFTVASSSESAGYAKFQALCFLSLAVGIAGHNRHAGELADQATTIGRAHDWFNGDAADSVLLARILSAGGMMNIDLVRESCVELDGLTSPNPQWRLFTDSIQTISLAALGEFEKANSRIAQITHRPEVEHATDFVRYALSYAQIETIMLSGNPGRALNLIERHRSRYPNTSEFGALQSCAYLSLGLTRLALSKATTFIKANEATSQAGTNLAQAVRAAAILRLGRPDQAVSVLAEMIDRMAEFGALGLALLPKSLLHSMMLEAASRDVKLPDMLARAYNLPSNRLDAVLLSVGTLTRSEREVLLAMRNTGTFDDIAARTFSARNTVKTHARHIYAKLGVLGREEAVDIGETCGFFELGVPIVDTPNAISAQDH